MSGTPLPSMSPMPSTYRPNAALAERRGPPRVVMFTSAVLRAVPSLPMNSRWTAPASAPPASSPGAPTARSGTPLPSMSPTPATNVPNLSRAARSGPPGVVAFTPAVRRTVPSLPMNSR